MFRSLQFIALVSRSLFVETRTKRGDKKILWNMGQFVETIIIYLIDCLIRDDIKCRDDKLFIAIRFDYPKTERYP